MLACQNCDDWSMYRVSQAEGMIICMSRVCFVLPLQKYLHLIMIAALQTSIFSVRLESGDSL